MAGHHASMVAARRRASGAWAAAAAGEAVEAGPDDVAFGEGPGQGEQGAEFVFDRVGLQDLHVGVAGVDQ